MLEIINMIFSCSDKVGTKTKISDKIDVLIESLVIPRISFDKISKNTSDWKK